MKTEDTKKTRHDDFDHLAAGKMQLVIATIAIAQVLYWNNIGKTQAVSSKTVTDGVISVIDWGTWILLVMALPIVVRGIYLVRKGLAEGSNPTSKATEADPADARSINRTLIEQKSEFDEDGAMRKKCSRE